MGQRSKFTFPVPGRKPKPAAAASSAGSAPLTKAQKILGTGEISLDGASSRQWDARSGISISISESSASYSATNEGGLGTLEEEDDDDDRVTGQRTPRGWDAESEVIPRQWPGRGLRMQRSAATIGNDYQTDASSVRRRESNASVMFQHYDPNKVPLAISQQTSNSAMAKGLPRKANSLLDVDGTIAGPFGKKKKPARLDLSRLKPRSRRSPNLQPGPVLNNDYVTRSPSMLSIASSLGLSSHSKVNRKSKSSGGASDAAYTPSPRDNSELRQLYDHYEQRSIREAMSPEEEVYQETLLSPSPAEPTPALTSASTMRTAAPLATPYATALSNPVIREPHRNIGHRRTDSGASKSTLTSTTSPPPAHSYQSPRKDYASSISSRNTRASKSSRNFESDLQKNSVLSLSDSESDDGTFSDSAPKSSMSSWGNTSHDDDASISAESRVDPALRFPISQETYANKSKRQSFAQLNDYLAVPSPGAKGHNPRAPSSSTVRSASSSNSTATAISNAIAESSRGSRLSASTVETTDYAASLTSSHRTRGTHDTSIAGFSNSPRSTHTDHHSKSFRDSVDASNHRLSSQLTPPLSPSTVDLDYYTNPPDSAIHAEFPIPPTTQVQEDGRLMAVTKQEEMLLAALRKKRARMRENIIAELENERASLASHRSNSTIGGSPESKKLSILMGKLEAMDSKLPNLDCPQLPPLPVRNSSLVTSFKHLTERSGSVRMVENKARPTEDLAYRADDKPDSRDNRMSDMSGRSQGSGRRERVLMYLDRPIHSIDDIDAAEPSPDLSEFMDYDQDSDGEIIPERRSSRVRSRYSTRHSRTIAGRPRADSNPLAPLSPHNASNLRTQLENLPESRYEGLEDFDEDFDGFSDVMGHDEVDPQHHHHHDDDQGIEIARPDSPEAAVMGHAQNRRHIRGKNSAVRLSAVGYINGLPLEAALWGDDG
ncbi:hypothetical protein BX600DRAFT_436241 [Xylariales sp. PMI_506]|nr:hypothetical protein BX600DRAFT_436241 [Xylariales sp. PMI_506]